VEHPSAEVYLNQLAQGLVRVSEGVAWFGRLAPDQQRTVLRDLVYFARQVLRRHVRK
jgi:uncharacterized protein YjeT (DUF2065 family)